jgi:uncharacterized protein (DUF58 family)
MKSAAGCALLGLLLLLVAGTFDAEPFYVTGAALMLLGAATAAWITAGAWGVTVHRELGARSVMEGEPLTLRVEVRAGRFPLPPGFVDEALLDAPAPVAAGRRRSRIRIEATFGRRGRRTLQAPAVVLRDPLGLAERTVRAPHDDEVLVLPRIYPVVTAAAGGEDTGAHARALLTSAAETEIDGLRPHQTGSPASRIHWPSVAKGGEIMERKLIAEADSRPLVVLDPRAPKEPEHLDMAIRAAASLVRHFAPRIGCALLLPGDRRAVVIEPDLGGFPNSHVRLALLEADSGGPALVAAQNRRGLIMFVSARRIEKPPRGLGRTPGGLVLVIPGGLPSRRAVLEVAGCQGFLGARTGSAAAMEAVTA